MLALGRALGGTDRIVRSVNREPPRLRCARSSHPCRAAARLRGLDRVPETGPELLFLWAENREALTQATAETEALTPSHSGFQDCFSTADEKRLNRSKQRDRGIELGPLFPLLNSV